MIKPRTYCRLLLKTFSTKVKVAADDNLLNKIENNVFKPRNHPGILKPRVVSLPDAFIKATINVLEDYPVKSILEDGKTLSWHLRFKKPPVEKRELKKTAREVEQRVISRLNISDIKTEAEQIKALQLVNNKVSNILKKEVYNWKPVDYNAYNSLVYLFTRAAAEYAVLYKIFSEIATRDPDFSPRSLFDFGSGVGTVTWAANEFWKKSFFEYFNVDSSADMNDLAQILLQNGRANEKMSLRGVFYRQFLPVTRIAYDLVVSSYTFLELPSQQSRMQTILNLWNKTQKYLVIVEQGSNAGFQVINEMRDFILHTKEKNDLLDVHVFSPCPHDKTCPRFMSDDGTPCNFEMAYWTIPVGATSMRKQERYSYVVFKKSKRETPDSQWPRVVRETLVRSKHTICRICSKNGELEEVIFTGAKHGKNLYHCARATKWGDLLPISIQDSCDSDEA